MGGIVVYWSLGRPPIEVSPTIDYDEIHHPTTIPLPYHITINIFYVPLCSIPSIYYRCIGNRWVVHKILNIRTVRFDLLICTARRWGWCVSSSILSTTAGRICCGTPSVIYISVNIKIRRGNGAYRDDVTVIIVIQSSTSIQNSEEVVGYIIPLIERQMNNLHTDNL